MPGNTREPLTPEERTKLRLSLYWALAGGGVFALWYAIVVLNEVLDYATIFGVPEHQVASYLSELVPIPFFFAFMAGLGVSIAHATPVIRKRPVCLVWLLGVPGLLLGVIPAIGLVVLLTR